MPIRFRCAYCNQLLGISRRKAGQVVRCPTCAGQVVVPQPEDGAADGPAPPPAKTSAATSPPVFERSDFDELFNAPAAAPPTAGVAPPPPAEVFDVEPVGAPPAPAAAPPVLDKPPLPAGIVLSPARATLLTVAAIVAIALAFGAGLLVGRRLGSAPPPAPVPTTQPGQLEGRLLPPDAPPAYG